MTNIVEPDPRTVTADGDAATVVAASASTVTAATVAASPVLSVFSRTGAVVAVANDYAASEVENDSTVAGATVKAALETLASSSIADGDKGDIVVSGSGTVWTLDSGVVTAAAKTVLDDATVAAMVDTLGGATSTGTGGLVRATSPDFAGVVDFAASGIRMPDGGANYLCTFGVSALANNVSFLLSLTGATDTTLDMAAGSNNFGASTFPQTGLRAYDSDGSHLLVLKPDENLTGNRVLSLITGDANRSITLSGNLTVSGAATVSGTNTGDQSTFSTVAVSGQSDVVADSATDTLTLAAGTGIAITTNATTDTVTIASSTPARLCYVLSGPSIVLTNMPLAATWMAGTVGQYYLKADLALCNYVRLVGYCVSAGTANSKVRVGYDTTPSSPPVIGDFSADIGTSEVSISLAATGLLDTGWVALAAGAKANDVYIALETSGGDGAADPRVASLTLEFKQ